MQMEVLLAGGSLVALLLSDEHVLSYSYISTSTSHCSTMNIRVNE